MVNAPYIETECVFEFEGRAFESGGSIVTEAFAIGYVDGLEDAKIGGLRSANWRGAAVIKNWHGDQIIGRIIGAQSWRTPQSYVSGHMWQITAIINGLEYTGRSAGDGMLWRGRRTARDIRRPWYTWHVKASGKED